MGRIPHERPRARLRRFLERDYRGAPARLARDIGQSPKVAENLLNGHWPNDLTLSAIVRRFGRDVIDALFLAEVDETLARLSEEESRLERALEATRAARRQAEGRGPGGEGSAQAASLEGRGR